MATDNEYGFEPKTSTGIFLRLKERGDSVILRVASAPYREPVVWKEGVKSPLTPEQTAKLTDAQWAGLMRDPDYSITDQYHWVVIDRADGTAKIFSGTAGIYKSLKEYAQMEQWGNPRNYDVKIVRTEEPGRNYYTVTALPDKSELSDGEKRMVDSIHMGDQRPNARPTSDVQIDDISDYLNKLQAGVEVGSSGTTAVSGRDKAAKVADDLRNKKPEPEPEEPEPVYEDPIITDVDEPINLDDIPF